MVKHRIRRWLQFGVLDLLILTAVVAVVAVLWRPAQAKGKATPWVPGVWGVDENLSEFSLWLLPDGCFEHKGSVGHSWKLARSGQSGESLLLLCEAKRFVLRYEPDGWVMDLPGEDGKVPKRLKQIHVLKGPIHEGSPHGVWAEVDADDRGQDRPGSRLLTYQNGELIDLHHSGRRDLYELNIRRRVRGLPPRTASDFLDDHWYRVHSRDDLTASPTR